MGSQGKLMKKKKHKKKEEEEAEEEKKKEKEKKKKKKKRNNTKIPLAISAKTRRCKIGGNEKKEENFEYN